MIRFFHSGFQHHLICQYVAARLGNRGWTPDNTASIAALHGGAVRGAIIFHDWNPEAGVMCLSAAGRQGWLGREILALAHEYVFTDSGCQLAVLQVSERNDLMRRTAETFGYEGVRVPRLRGREEAEMIYTFPQEKWADHPVRQWALKRGIISGTTGSARRTALPSEATESANEQTLRTQAP